MRSQKTIGAYKETFFFKKSIRITIAGDVRRDQGLVAEMHICFCRELTMTELVQVMTGG